MKKLLTLCLLIATLIASSQNVIVNGPPALKLYSGNNSPNGGLLSSNPGDLYLQSSGSAIGTLWLHQTSGVNGWVQLANVNQIPGSVVVSDSAWSLTGNAGTNPAVNFVGTIDGSDFVMKEQVDATDSIMLQFHNKAGVKGARFYGADELTFQIDANNEAFYVQKSDTSTNVNNKFVYIDGNQAIGKVLTSDANGNASWTNGQLPNSVDSLTGLTGQTYSPAKNTATAIKASSTIVSLAVTVPVGVTGDALEFGFKNNVTTLSFSGTGSSGLPSIAVTAGQHITLRNTSGEWSFD